MIPISDAFDAIRDGTFADFVAHYRGDPNERNKDLGLSLLLMTVVNDKNPEDKLQIIRFLLDAGADVNTLHGKHRWNVLSLFYTSVPRADPEYLVRVTSIFITAGVDVNHVDRVGAPPLAAAIGSLRASTEDLLPLFRLLLDAGADPYLKDSYGDDAIGYAMKFPWRSDLIPVLEGAHGRAQ